MSEDIPQEKKDEILLSAMALVRSGWTMCAEEMARYCAENKVSEGFCDMVIGLLDREKKRQFDYKKFEKELEALRPELKSDLAPLDAEQNEMWGEVGKIVMDGYDYAAQEDTIYLLKSKFIVTRKK